MIKIVDLACLKAVLLSFQMVHVLLTCHNYSSRIGFLHLDFEHKELAYSKTF